MIFLPAIDLMDGKCVRLLMGQKEKKNVYSDNPEWVARQFEANGAHGLHVVDLDGAFNEKGSNSQSIREITKAVSIPVEVGGGIRSIENIATLLSLGVSSVILGTAAVKNPEMVESAVSQFGSNIIIAGIDARAGKVAVQGWIEETDINAFDLALCMKEKGVKRIIYTDINKDGMMTGPNIKETKRLAEKTGMEIIASGGINSLEDIKALLRIEEYGVVGFITGVALYEGNFTVKEVVNMVKARGLK